MVTTANSARRGPPDTVDRVDRAGNRSLIEAARSAGVRHLVFVSATGVSVDHPVPFMAAKAETEAALRASGLEWTILAAEPFMEVWLGMIVAGPALAGGEVVYVGSGMRRHSFVSVADVAAFGVSAIRSPAATNAVLPIGGPEAISFHDAVSAFEAALGRPVPQRGVAPGEPLPGMPEPVVALLTGLDLGDLVVDSRELARTFGVTQTPLDSYVRSVTAPRLAHALTR